MLREQVNVLRLLLIFILVPISFYCLVTPKRHKMFNYESEKMVRLCLPKC